MSAIDTTDRPLRILHTENSLAWGGQELRILGEAHGMLERGHRVELLACPDAPITAEARRLGIPVHPLSIVRKDPPSLLRLRAWLAQHAHRYDVVNTHSSTDSWLTALASTTVRAAPPIVRTRHVSTPVNDHAPTRWLYLRATAHIVTTGETLRRRLHERNGFPLARMTSVRTGIDLVRFAPSDRTAARARLGLGDRPLVGIVATLRSWKGHADLLHAFAAAAPSLPDGTRLLVIGDGPQRARLETLAATLGLADTVRFVGHVVDVPAWLAALDLFVLPSTGDEGVPQAVMQAMGCGLPVVSTTVGAIAEAVDDGRTGLLLPPGRPDRLRDAIVALLDDAATRRAMGAAGARKAHAAFGRDAMLALMEAVFRVHSRGFAPRPREAAYPSRSLQ